ncbi:hypothetical protein [Rhizobium leguminosarum]|uniref:hypothetical protein n=1 Tax=Rhizobium leguminosarum TaxID=384 RepID=UPI001FEDA66C|nr:hypothetical protein [Rhizobium leguminosarum]
MKLGWQPRKWLEKKSKRGNRGYPMGTIAYYGPDNRRASKAAVSIIPALHADPADLRRWFAETGDLRMDETVIAEIAAFLRENEVKSVVMVDNHRLPSRGGNRLSERRGVPGVLILEGTKPLDRQTRVQLNSRRLCSHVHTGRDHASELVRRR